MDLLIASIITNGVLVFGAITQFILSRRQANHSQKQDEEKLDHQKTQDNDRQAFEIYKALVDTLQKQLSDFQIKYLNMEKVYMDTREENAILKEREKFRTKT